MQPQRQDGCCSTWAAPTQLEVGEVPIKMQNLLSQTCVGENVTLMSGPGAVETSVGFEVLQNPAKG